MKNIWTSNNKDRSERLAEAIAARFCTLVGKEVSEFLTSASFARMLREEMETFELKEDVAETDRILADLEANMAALRAELEFTS